MTLFSVGKLLSNNDYRRDKNIHNFGWLLVISTAASMLKRTTLDSCVDRVISIPKPCSLQLEITVIGFRTYAYTKHPKMTLR